MLPYRIGIGHDTHRLATGGPLILGGLQMEADVSALGHSDGDVLLHALTDALLGAVSEGDIGELFPDTDNANRGRNSSEMLHLVYARVCELGYRIVNIDCIVFLERPKLGQWKAKISQRIAELLSLEIKQVSLKAKTGEGVDAVGNREAIAAQCIVLLHRGDE